MKSPQRPYPDTLLLTLNLPLQGLTLVIYLRIMNHYKKNSRPKYVSRRGHAAQTLIVSIIAVGHHFPQWPSCFQN